MADPLAARLARAPILLDAAMGTQLIAQGLDLSWDDPCLWVDSHPDAVLAVHQGAIAAGAEALFTNTFGANRFWLTRFGRGSDVAPLNRRAVALARLATGPDRFVLGSIGPTVLGDGPGPLWEQAETLLDAGADGLVLETFRHEQALAALDALRSLDRPIWVGLFDWPESIGSALKQLTGAGAAVVGLNCTADWGLIGRFLTALAEPGTTAGWLKPAGEESGDSGVAPGGFRLLARRLGEIGRGAMGGCCGTTAEHLGAIRAEWDDVASEQHA